jgi:hypothetical protein
MINVLRKAGTPGLWDRVIVELPQRPNLNKVRIGISKNAVTPLQRFEVAVVYLIEFNFPICYQNKFALTPSPIYRKLNTKFNCLY